MLDNVSVEIQKWRFHIPKTPVAFLQVLFAESDVVMPPYMSNMHPVRLSSDFNAFVL